MANTLRIPIAVAAVVIWILITVWGVWTPHDPTSLTAGISGGVAWSIVGAGAFMLVVVLALGWRDIGFNAPQPWSSLRVLAFPAIYIVLFAAGVALIGLPAPSVVFFLAINTLAVGFSEEIAFRGVLFRALHTRLRLWPSIWIAAIAFGGVHVVNGFTTGDFLNASVQALTAFMSGIFFMALVLRTRSIIPSMLFHALWDFLLTTIGAGSASSGAAASGDRHWWVLLVPPLFILPNFLYGLWLLRKVQDTGPAQ
ncbi:MAG: hypothetical protein JWP26_755 [Devosia sp.]|uniref:CPBP family intramembrane glutamic endopeptidase n=1 Tax=Devosia sp. TaxID=1871048 RepID=UPI0026099997|nr:CPBP family intramembrane glutamic endopeptidase [Devosia sp.]MDB5585785.1 hypothetical protein [Devosia sp.]